jgi:hypothetical protein
LIVMALLRLGQHVGTVYGALPCHEWFGNGITQSVDVANSGAG